MGNVIDGVFFYSQVSSMEAHFQLAVRDACLADQRDVIGCMWRMLRSVGVTREAAIEAARRDGVFGMYDGSEQTGEETEVYALEGETVVGARAKEICAACGTSGYASPPKRESTSMRACGHVGSTR